MFGYETRFISTRCIGKFILLQNGHTPSVLLEYLLNHKLIEGDRNYDYPDNVGDK